MHAPNNIHFLIQISSILNMVRIGELAPNLEVSEWVQGLPTNIDNEKDKVILVEVFQVNCPGCFLYGLPHAISIYNNYADDGVRVLGLATAFEDYDKNTLENLKMLAETGAVVGETKATLNQYGKLDDGKLQYKIPFALAMDKLVKSAGVTQNHIMDLIRAQVPDFESHPAESQQYMMRQAKEYLQAKQYSAKTFEAYSLRGTPSTILIDRKGILRDMSFGQNPSLESMVQKLASE